MCRHFRLTPPLPPPPSKGGAWYGAMSMVPRDDVGIFPYGVFRWCVQVRQGCTQRAFLRFAQGTARYGRGASSTMRTICRYAWHLSPFEGGIKGGCGQALSIDNPPSPPSKGGLGAVRYRWCHGTMWASSPTIFEVTSFAGIVPSVSGGGEKDTQFHKTERRVFWDFMGSFPKKQLAFPHLGAKAEGPM